MNKNIKNFIELDIRVGKIVSAEEFPEIIKPSYILNIDFGEEIGIKKTSAQITNYSIESLINKKCIGIINLGDKQIGSIMSQCLVLGSTDINGDVLLLNPDKDASLGDKVS
ncbi:MAG: tRNA-binding protein [Candidatus Actinomarinales bacterium]|nr:MAG: tRNA-binding protein [Candidatus Actinomarinales bacterium]